MKYQILHVVYVIDNVRVFLPNCPLTTVRSLLSVDELHIVRDEAEDTFVVRPHYLNQLLTVVRGHFGRKKQVQVSDLYDNNWQLFDR